MKLLPLLLGLLIFALHANAEPAIPPELRGAWSAATTFIWVRADGLCMMAGSIGSGGVATYDPKTRILTLSLRDERTGKEAGRVTALYDPKALTLTPREKGYEAIYKRVSEELGEPFNSMDLKKVLQPSK